MFDLQVSASVLTLSAASGSEALACLDMFAREEPHQPPQSSLRTSEGAQQLTSGLEGIAMALF